MNMNDLLTRNVKWTKTQIQRKTTYSDWKCNLAKELLLCRERTMDCGLTVYDINLVLNEICTN